MDEKTIARFWSKVERRGADECWPWRAAIHPGGYGMLGVKHRPFLTHRVSWAIANGPIPDGMCVLHRCDNPPCVNPAHLFLGTQGDNMADKVLKGRQQRGESAYNTKYPDETIRTVRRLRAAGVSLQSIESQTGVRRGYLRNLVSGARRRHVK